MAELLERFSTDPEMFFLTGDLGFGVIEPLQERYPTRCVNVGVAEQNMAGIAAGLALEGLRVVVYSIANFPLMRALEQVRNDICYHGCNVLIAAVGGGFSYGALGYSHHATEDVAIARAMPGMGVVVPCSVVEVRALTHLALDAGGPWYFRLDKSAADDTAPAEVRLGVPRVLRDGQDVTIFAMGGIAQEALDAAEKLEATSVSAKVVSVHTIRPLDVQAISSMVRDQAMVVTLEEHSLAGGLASAILDSCASSGVWPRRLLRLGLRESFAPVVGSQMFLRRLAGLGSEQVADAVLGALSDG